MQLHKLTSEADFSNCRGSISRSSELGVLTEDVLNTHINTTDLTELYDFIQSKAKYFTTLQKNLADTTINGLINTYDLNIIELALGYATGSLTPYSDNSNNVNTEQGVLGDVNNDGVINISDIVVIVSYILNQQYTESADMNLGGIVNVSDIVAAINSIFRD